MAIGNYGIVRGSDVNINNISVFYNYTPTREIENNEFIEIDAGEILSECSLPDSTDLGENYTEKIMEGMYNLRLPATTFNQIGVYTIYIKPKTFSMEIADCGVLSAFPNVKGLVINEADLPDDNLRANNGLQGYRIEYVNDNGEKRRNTVRYVVTSNRVSLVNENVGDSSQKSTRYRFDDNGSMIFLQITPSSASGIKANSFPFIGTPGQTILMSNTFFSPVMLEINMVEHDIDSVANSIIGEQIRDVKNGIVTLFDNNREITNQYNMFIIKDDVTDVPLYEIKEKRTNIDNSQNFDNVLDGINQ
ncbi:MAG: hypothetical protein ACOCVF_00315 [bacterium]